MDGMGVEISIVLARAEGSVFLGDKEKQCCLRRLGRDDAACFEVFIDEHSTCFVFLRVQWVDLGDFGGKQQFKINGVVIGLV